METKNWVFLSPTMSAF